MNQQVSDAERVDSPVLDLVIVIYTGQPHYLVVPPTRLADGLER